MSGVEERQAYPAGMEPASTDDAVRPVTSGTVVSGTLLPVRRRMVVAGFVVFTAFVWVQRLVNLARGDESDIAVSVVLSVVMLVLGAASAVALAAAWRQRWSVPGWVARLWRVAAVATVVVWVVRAAQITLAWRSPGFVLVHVLLAVVSIALAVGTWRAASPAD